MFETKPITPDSPILDELIDTHLETTVRVANALHNAQVKTFRDLLKLLYETKDYRGLVRNFHYRSGRFSSRVNFGKKSWDDLVQALKNMGITLPIDPELFTLPPDPCPTCGSRDPAHRWDSHAITVVSEPGMPVVATIDMQRYYDSGERKGRMLSTAIAELREFFPGKSFSFVPTRMMSTRQYENTVLHGVDQVAEYLAYENP